MPRRRGPSRQQIEQFLAVIPSDRRRDRVFFRLLADTGLGAEDALVLRVEDLQRTTRGEPEGALIQFPGARGGSTHKRPVRLAAPLAQELQQYLAHIGATEGYLFRAERTRQQRTDAPLRYQSLHERWQGYCALAGVACTLSEVSRARHVDALREAAQVNSLQQVRTRWRATHEGRGGHGGREGSGWTCRLDTPTDARRKRGGRGTIGVPTSTPMPPSLHPASRHPDPMHSMLPRQAPQWVQWVDVLIDRHIVGSQGARDYAEHGNRDGSAGAETSSTSASPTPWRYTAMTGGYCTYAYFEQYAHRMACPACGFFHPSDLLSEDRTERMLRVQQEVQLTELEARLLSGELTWQEWWEACADVPTPAGPTLSELSTSQSLLPVDPRARHP